MASPQSELLDALSSLYMSPRYSDLTVVCNEQLYPVHRAILCSRSRFFDGACSGRFAEANSREIDLSEDDEEAIEHMMHYFYHLDYLQPDPNNDDLQQHQSKSSKARFTLQDVQDPLLATATAVSEQQQQPSANPQQHGNIAFGSIIPVPPPSPESLRSRSPSPKRRPTRTSARTHNKPRVQLRQNAEASGGRLHLASHASSHAFTSNNMERQNTSDLVVHARVYALAEKYGIQGLKGLARDKFEVLVAHHWDEEDFLDAAAEVYTSTIDKDRGLRSIVLQAFRQRPELASRNDIQEVVHELPSLAFDLYRIFNGIPIQD